MHLDQTDLAPLFLLLMTLIPLFFVRRRIRSLEQEETRMVQESTSYAARGEHPLPAPNVRSITGSHRVVADNRRKLAEVRLDLAHYRMLRKRALRMLFPCGIFLAVMLFI